jgi:hypothetical protein
VARPLNYVSKLSRKDPGGSFSSDVLAESEFVLHVSAIICFLTMSEEHQEDYMRCSGMLLFSLQLTLVTSDLEVNTLPITFRYS